MKWSWESSEVAHQRWSSVGFLGATDVAVAPDGKLMGCGLRGQCYNNIWLCNGR